MYICLVYSDYIFLHVQPSEKHNWEHFCLLFVFECPKFCCFFFGLILCFLLFCFCFVRQNRKMRFVLTMSL